MAKVLVVDDASFMRKRMAKILGELGHEVLGEAENGEQAISMFDEISPELVMLDITMPVLSGKDALIKIKQKHDSANIVMCSALGSETMIADCIRFGARGYIVKPYTKERVEEAISKVLAG